MATEDRRDDSANDKKSANDANATATEPQSDRTQRRKEKKQRKKELSKETKGSSMENQPATVTADEDHSPPPPSNFEGKKQSTTTSQDTSLPKDSPNPIPVKPLIVLDLNGILCHRIRERNLPKQSTFRPSVGRISNTEVIPRSDLHDFLTLLHNNFSLAVWTSATRKTARTLVWALFPPHVRKGLVFIWHRQCCDLIEKHGTDSSASEKSKDGGDDNVESSTKKKKLSHEDIIAIKRLSKVWASFPRWNATNTILLDDSPEKCPSQFQGNALHPTPICGTVTFIQEDVNEIDIESDDASSKENISTEGSIVDDDEFNQRKQRDFFQLLANHWAESTSSSTMNMVAFLESHANVHNMGWKKGLVE
mmetsp:Transcript_45404/g.95294  ORF Transcript_45404/g.95294 Transcript_45404/m.95294 type:complete len:365 (+) Transcript_45404:3-1097(+)